MKLLSFDVGIVNLAYCIFETNSCKILKWEIIDLGKPFSAKIPSGNSQIAKQSNDIHITLIKELDDRSFLKEVDYVIIEKQPSFNPKMRIIGGCLQNYFYIRGVVDQPGDLKIKSIDFFSPKHKLKCYTGPELTIQSKTKSKYSQTKKMGVLIARAKLEEFSEVSEIKSFFESSKKKDDLSDCYLQAITYSIFKKFKSNGNGNCNVPVYIEHVHKPLNKIQIKKQLKEYLDPKIKVLSVIEKMQNLQNNLNVVINEIPLTLKNTINVRYSFEFPIDQENLTFIFTDLSMKSYNNYHYTI